MDGRCYIIQNGVCTSMAQGRSVEAEETLFEGDTEEAATCITQDNAFLDSVFQIVVWILLKLLRSTVFTRSVHAQ